MDSSAVELTQEMLEQLVQQSTALGWVYLLLWAPMMLLLTGVGTVITWRLAHSGDETAKILAISAGVMALLALIGVIATAVYGIDRLVVPLETSLGGVFGGY